ncbi:MAG: hypothetical protein J7L53_07750 [Deltaproteobacteria bacterium]|nr:hypothetical protein [Deltaproteobacteria bacterium]
MKIGTKLCRGLLPSSARSGERALLCDTFIFILRCERGTLIRVYMKKESGVRIQNPEVMIYVIIKSEVFWLLDTFSLFPPLADDPRGIKVYEKTICKPAE